MSIIDAELLLEDRGASESEGGKLERYHTWFLTSDDPEDDSSVVIDYMIATSSLPWVGSGYKSVEGGAAENAMLCRRAMISEVPNTPQCWRVRLDYSTSDRGTDGGENPLLEMGQVRCHTAGYQRPMMRDVNEKLAVDPFGKLLDPPIMIDDSRPILSIVRNEPMSVTWPIPDIIPESRHPNFSFDNVRHYQDTVNNSSYAPIVGQGSFPAGTCKISGINSEPASFVYRLGGIATRISYRRVTYEIHVRAKDDLKNWLFPGWEHHELDASMQRRDEAFGVPTHITVDNALVTAPVPVKVTYDEDKKGKPIQRPGSVIIPLDIENGEEPTFKIYQPYRTVHFGNLHLDRFNE